LAAVMLVGLGGGAVKAGPPVRSAFDYVRQHGYVHFPDKPVAKAPAGRGPRVDLYQVGDTRSFWSWDLSQMPPLDVQVPSTCRAVGAHTYVFVADDQWGVHVEQADVDAVLAALETATPQGSIHPDQGIVPNEIEVFGPVPDALDGDPRVIILLMELQSYGGQQFDGYFNALNEYTDEEAMAEEGYHSNEAEMITVNSAIRPVTSDMTLSILAHELQHLIHWGADVDEVSWVNESMSEAAMTVNGYFTDQAWLQDYLNDPSASLYEVAYVHYGACLLFGSYLFERFGAGFLHSVVADPANGEAGFTASLAAVNEPISMEDLLLDWATATVGDSLGADDARWTHSMLQVGAPTAAGQIDAYPSQAPLSGSLGNTGTAYLRLANTGVDVRASLDATPADGMLARVIMVEPDGQAWSGAFDQGQVEIPFSGSEAQAAWVVLMAKPGLTVPYSLTAEAVDEQPDGGETDGGETDGGGDQAADAGQDAGADDAGADTDSGCPSDQELVFYDGEPTCVPICDAGQHPELVAGDWTCVGQGGGCGCAATGTGTASLLLPLLALLLGLAASKRH